MRRKLRTICSICTALTAAVCFIASPASGHHGTATSYDQDKWVTVTGVVTEFRWRNPHSSLHLDVTDDGGNVVAYAIELASPALAARQGNGWTRKTFKAGDRVTFRVHPSKSGAPVGECLFNCVVTINGTPLGNPTPAGRGSGRGTAEGTGR